MVTPYRLAELVAGPTLHDQGRNPVSTPIVDLTIRQVLADDPRSFADVAGHPSTITALRDLHRELRSAGPAALQALAAAGERGREAARVSAATATLLAADWYDEGDLSSVTIGRLRAGPVDGLERVIAFLPQPSEGLEHELLRAIGAAGDLQLLLVHTGVATVDAEIVGFAERLGTETVEPPAPIRRSASGGRRSRPPMPTTRCATPCGS